MHMLSEDTRISKVMDSQAAAQTTVQGDGVDMQADGGYDGVMFVALFGSIVTAATATLQLQESSDDGDSDAYSDISGASSNTDEAGDEGGIAVDIIADDNERYIRPEIQRADQNVEIDAVVAIQYRSGNRPTTQGAIQAVTKKT